MVAHTAYEGRGFDPICQFHLDIRVTSALFSNSDEEEYRVLIPFIKGGFNANSGESSPSELL
jgi:hypothetical protein